MSRPVFPPLVAGPPGAPGTVQPVALPGSAEGPPAAPSWPEPALAVLAAAVVWAVLATLGARRLKAAHAAAEARADALAAHLDRLARHMDDVAWAADADLRLTACFPPRGMPGGSDMPPPHQPLAALIGPDGADGVAALIAQAKANPIALEGRVVESSHPVTARRLETHLHPRLDAHGHLLAIEGFTRDVSTVHRLRAEVDGLAATDALTGLPTRRPFFATVERELARARRNRRWPVLMTLTLVHQDLAPPTPAALAATAVGMTPRDEVRHVLASVLAATVRPADALARIGEDSFAVLLAETSRPTAQDIANRIQTALAARLPHTQALRIGLAEPTVADNPDSLLRKAEDPRPAQQSDAIPQPDQS